jgi:hypothetical protein
MELFMKSTTSSATIPFILRKEADIEKAMFEGGDW